MRCSCSSRHVFLFEVDAEQRQQEWILVVQQAARVSVLAGVLEQPVESRLVVTPQCQRNSAQRSSMARSASRYVGFVRPIAIGLPVPVAVHASNKGIRGGCDRLTVSCDTRPDAFRSRRRRRQRRRFHRRPAWRALRAAAASTRTSSGSTHRRRRDRRSVSKPSPTTRGPIQVLLALQVVVGCRHARRCEVVALGPGD